MTAFCSRVSTSWTLLLWTCGVPVLLCHAVGAAPLQERPGGDVPGIDLLTSNLPAGPAKSPRVLFELRLAENEPVRGLTIEAHEASR